MMGRVENKIGGWIFLTAEKGFIQNNSKWQEELRKYE